MITGRNSEWDGIKREVSIDLEGATLEGTLTLPKGADGLVLFAMGAGAAAIAPGTATWHRYSNHRELPLC